MAVYRKIQKEETFKATVFRVFFNSSKYAYEPNIGNIDFIVTEAKTLKGNIWTRHYLWAEAKKGVADIHSMLTQLILTVKKTYEKGEHLPPPYIACFDIEKIAFVPFHDILPIFNDNDVNWNIAPSNHTTADFIKTKKKIKNLSKKNIIIFNFDADKKEITNFINKNLVAGNITAKFEINKNNFVIIYDKWLEKVRKTIAIDWSAVKKSGIIDGDFFLADLLSKENYTLKDKLFVILMNNQYKFDKKFDDAGFSLYKEVGFNDSQKAHKEFWDKYERPPHKEYWDYIKKRRDLLVTQDIRERKGSFFTPREWVELSQEYIGDVLGEDWQDEYYVWDCAAGTGNLLAGLTNKLNIWASTLDKADVDVMKDRIKHGANLLEKHVFQFDFLNDDFKKLPKSLQAVINNKEKRKKLIIYINPPYAEGGSSKQKTGTAKYKKDNEKSKIHDRYHHQLSGANRELFAQFLIRIYNEIPDCIIANFSKLKHLQGAHFKDFRNSFKARLEKMFVCPAETFDNVVGKFGIGFYIWNLQYKEKFNGILSDVYLSKDTYLGTKHINCYDSERYFSEWVNHIKRKEGDEIGWIEGLTRNSFQHNGIICILNNKEQMAVPRGMVIYSENLIGCCIAFTIRKCINANWLNDRDQFVFPNNDFKTDEEFQTDCLTFTIFNNNIQSKYGVNHCIPFSEKDVNAKDNFESSFMYDYINGNRYNYNGDLFSDHEKTKMKKLCFSSEAKTVFNAGKKLWKYYHLQPSANVNASLYDIREFFQGRDDSGKMNNTSGDDKYSSLMKQLRQNLSVLTEKIQPKVYEYGFLL